MSLYTNSANSYCFQPTLMAVMFLKRAITPQWQVDMQKYYYEKRIFLDILSNNLTLKPRSCWGILCHLTTYYSSSVWDIQWNTLVYNELKILIIVLMCVKVSLFCSVFTMTHSDGDTKDPFIVIWTHSWMKLPDVLICTLHAHSLRLNGVTVCEVFSIVSCRLKTSKTRIRCSASTLQTWWRENNYIYI